MRQRHYFKGNFNMFSYSVDGLISALGVGYYILVYAFGAIAMLLSITAFQLKRRVSIILCVFCGESCWVIHFLLQGDLTSAIACTLSATMLAVFSRKDKWKWAVTPFTVTLFIVLICGFSLLGFKEWKDIFPLIASIFAVIANSRSSERSLRFFAAFWYFFWMLNSVTKLYPIALANDILCMSSTIVALIRYRKKPDDKSLDITE